MDVTLAHERPGFLYLFMPFTLPLRRLPDAASQGIRHYRFMTQGTGVRQPRVLQESEMRIRQEVEGALRELSSAIDQVARSAAARHLKAAVRMLTGYTINKKI